MVRVEHVLENWKAVRQATITAVEEFPASEMDFRPTPDVMTFSEIAKHILQAGEGLTGLLLAGEENLTGPDARDRIMKAASAVTAAGPDPASLAAALRDSVERRTAQLAAQPAEFFAQMMTRMDGQRVTRLEMLQMVKEHELTHRTQLFMYMRMKGLVPEPTRRRMPRPATD